MTEAAAFIPPEKTAEAAPKAKKTPSLKRSKFNELYPDHMALAVLAESNPKKVGSKAHAMFDCYANAKTVGEARRNGVSYQSIAYDVARSFIKLG